jgi:acetyl esterase/lipase
VIAVGAALLTLASRAGADQSKAAGGAAPRHYDVQVTRDLVYYDIPNDPDRYRHRLDVYRPKAKRTFPVLVFWHGGAWMIGQKDDYLGIYGYGTIARCLAERGLVVVLPNYRLSPGVRHPEHIKDAARAFAWSCGHVERYGGDPKQIFIGGHSAGGHLAALLATDESYLKKEGRSRRDIRGVIGASGVYRVDNLELKLELPGPGGAKVMRSEVRPLAVAFGDDPKVAKRASPLTHVCRGLPPFLLLNAQFDYLPLPPMAREFAAALKKNGCEVRTKTIGWCTHETLVFDILRQTAEPATVDEIVGFIHRHTPKASPADRGARPGTVLPKAGK